MQRFFGRDIKTIGAGAGVVSAIAGVIGILVSNSDTTVSDGSNTGTQITHNENNSVSATGSGSAPVVAVGQNAKDVNIQINSKGPNARETVSNLTRDDLYVETKAGTAGQLVIGVGPIHTDNQLLFRGAEFLIGLDDGPLKQWPQADLGLSVYEHHVFFVNSLKPPSTVTLRMIGTDGTNTPDYVYETNFAEQIRRQNEALVAHTNQRVLDSIARGRGFKCRYYQRMSTRSICTVYEPSVGIPYKSVVREIRLGLDSSSLSWSIYPASPKQPDGVEHTVGSRENSDSYLVANGASQTIFAKFIYKNGNSTETIAIPISGIPDR